MIHWLAHPLDYVEERRRNRAIATSGCSEMWFCCITCSGQANPKRNTLANLRTSPDIVKILRFSLHIVSMTYYRPKKSNIDTDIEYTGINTSLCSHLMVENAQSMTIWAGFCSHLTRASGITIVPVLAVARRPCTCICAISRGGTRMPLSMDRRLPVSLVVAPVRERKPPSTGSSTFDVGAIHATNGRYGDLYFSVVNI